MNAVQLRPVLLNQREEVTLLSLRHKNIMGYPRIGKETIHDLLMIEYVSTM